MKYTRETKGVTMGLIRIKRLWKLHFIFMNMVDIDLKIYMCLIFFFYFLLGFLWDSLIIIVDFLFFKPK